MRAMRSDAFRRGARTLFQIGFVQAVISLLEAFNVIGLNETQRVAIITVMTPLFAVFQNALEDNGSVPALLKAPASSGENPIPDIPDEGAGGH